MSEHNAKTHTHSTTHPRTGGRTFRVVWRGSTEACLGPKPYPTATLRQPVSPANGVPAHTAMELPSPREAEEPTITQEPEPFTSDLRCEPATTSNPVGILVELDTEELLVDWS